MSFLKKVTTYLISGTLGVGKTSLIKQLLKQKPENQRWAVLINEFGQIGVDKALLTSEQQVNITEIAGGCLCCTGGAPFQVGLTKLLHQAKPDVLFIELSGLGHPAVLQQQLMQAPWDSLLALQSRVLVVDANHATESLLDIEPTNIGLLVCNKSENITDEQRQILQTAFTGVPIYWTTEGFLPLSQLPQSVINNKRSLVINLKQLGGKIASAAENTQQLATDIICSVQQQKEGWAIGWLFSTDYCFDKVLVENWLKQLRWRRAKLVIQTEQGWLSVNGLEDEEIVWKPTEWRKDNRVELIFNSEQKQQQLATSLLFCLKQ